jgi:hypothetical protein
MLRTYVLDHFDAYDGIEAVLEGSQWQFTIITKMIANSVR